MESVESDRVRVTLTDEGVSHMVVKDVAQSPTPAEVAEDLDLAAQVGGSERRLAVWDLRELSARLPGGAWRNIIERIPDTLIAVAMIASEETAKNLGTFPEAIDSFLVPVRIFTDEDKAWAWIAAQRQALDPPAAS